ncbi:hypothetical protein QN408_25200, partial [Pseudomonas sp. CCI4.2]|uniref:hypothetical protein n=1 Tax=Pseudomonas sp. CCI4.2 TaxID=3048620 RepID=UPI002B231F21
SRLQRVRTEAFPNKFGPTDFGAAQISVGGAEGCDKSEGPSPTSWLLQMIARLYIARELNIKLRKEAP